MSKLAYVVPISGDLLILMEHEKEKSECPGKHLGPFSPQEKNFPYSCLLLLTCRILTQNSDFSPQFSHAMCYFDIYKLIVSIMKSTKH